MTTFASWLSVDSRGPSSIYMATDSRISWKPGVNWDQGRKVFAAKNSPQIFGYVGDVLFPSLALGQIVEAIDAGAFFSSDDSPQNRFNKVATALQKAFDVYPQKQALDFEIGYATREGDKMESRFHFFSFRWNKENGWLSQEWELPQVSDTIAIWGSGQKVVKKWKERWNSSSQKSTSRAMFSAVCDSIFSTTDEHTGGAAQLVGIYRVRNGMTFGFCDNGTAFVNGMPLAITGVQEGSLEWRNRLFERCRSNGDLIEKAQKHYAPKGLGPNAD